MATWVPVVILELIHAGKPNVTGGLCILDTEPTQSILVLAVDSWYTGESRSSGWRWRIHVSDLSAVDGGVLAYRGIDG